MPVIRKVVEKRPVFKRWDDAPRPRKDKRKKPKVEFACDECGKIFTITEADAKSRRFCSMECAQAENNIPLGVRFNLRWKLAESGCWEWQGQLNADGYGTIRDGDKNALAHRVGYRLFKGEMPEGLFACHKCGNRCCCNPAHLYAGTHADNMRDLAIDNTGSFSKTSWDDRRRMVEEVKSGKSTEVVAEAFGVSARTVRFWVDRFARADRIPESEVGLGTPDRRDRGSQAPG